MRKTISNLIKKLSPELWAISHFLIGTFIAHKKNLGDKDFEKARTHLVGALEFLTYDNNPIMWASCQQMLGTLYSTRIRSEDDINTEKAFFHFNEALKQNTQDLNPTEWARIQYKLGDIYVGFLENDGGRNIEKIILYYQNALEIMELKPTAPATVLENLEWAYTQRNLGSVFTKRQNGNRKENLEKSLFHYQKAVELFSSNFYPREWADVQFDIGTCYLQINDVHNNAENIDKAIFHLEQALNIQQRTSSYSKTAKSYHNLALAYSKCSDKDIASNISQAIYYYSKAIENYEKELDSDDWALSHSNLGYLFLEKEDNTEKSIYHYSKSLEVYTKENNQLEWADAQNNLGIAYWKRKEGVRADNLELAISHFNNALEVRTKEKFPSEWGAVNHMLGALYREKLHDNKSDNIEQAIIYYKNALEVFIQKGVQYKVFITNFNLGNTYSERIAGDYRHNQDKAITYYLKALRTISRVEYPEDWAACHNNLGKTYKNRTNGIPSVNIERAIYHYFRSLEIRTREISPSDWATTCRNLGNAYLDRIIGNRSENINLSFLYYERALEIHTRENYPKDWAILQDAIGTAYLMPIIGNPIENFEIAIQYFQKALEVCTYEEAPFDWARIKANMGTAYQSRIKGEPIDNIKQSISHLTAAIEFITPDNEPVQWANIQNSLGNAHSSCMSTDGDKEFDLAMFHFKQALEIRTHETMPSEWAVTQNNIGVAYLKLDKGHENAQEKAIYHFFQSLKVNTRQQAPFIWATAHHNIGLAYWHRTSGNHIKNLKRAISHFQKSLDVRTRELTPNDWASTHYLLGKTYHNLIDYGEDAIEQAVIHYKLSLEIYTPTSDPHLTPEIAASLGNLYYENQHYIEAYQAFTVAHDAIEFQRNERGNTLSKKEIAYRSDQMYARLIFCCIFKNDFESALKYTLAAKSRVFLDQLISARFQIIHARNENPRLEKELEEHQLIIQVLNTLRSNSLAKQELNNSNNKKDSEDQPVDPFEIFRNLEISHWGDIEQKYPALAATQNAPLVSAHDALKLAGKLNATIIEYYQHAQGWCAFIVSSESVNVCALDSMNDHFSKDMIDWIEKLSSPYGKGGASYKHLHRLYQTLIAPLKQHLPPSGSRLIIAPFGALHLFPFAAAFDETMQRYLAEDYIISFTASSAALQTSKKQMELSTPQSKNTRQRLLSVAYSGPENSKYHLPNVIPEAHIIAKYFSNVTTLHEENATPDEVISHASGQHVIHFGCHGIFDTDLPQQSGLILSKGWLNVQRIITELKLGETEIVTLGACLSGKLNVFRGDELMGLTQAMLTAGAKSVVGSLWSVDDLSTRTFFDVFYNCISAGNTTADAMHYAMKAIREQSNYKHPYYWAAFTVSGLAFISAQPTNIPN